MESFAISISSLAQIKVSFAFFDESLIFDTKSKFFIFTSFVIVLLGCNILVIAVVNFKSVIVLDFV